jgi:phage N-6-adenine-methyltransferase
MITATKRQDWRTPARLFQTLQVDYAFDVDASASIQNHLLPDYWTKAHDALSMSLKGRRAFCNPPFGMISEFLTWGLDQRQDGFSCFLIPANVETDWFHSLARHGQKHVFRRRVAYAPPPGSWRYVFDDEIGSMTWVRVPVKVSQPSFASMLCMFGPDIKPSGIAFTAVRDGVTGEIEY